MFWQYHDKLYASQNGENQGAFKLENLKQFAADLKLDTQAFNTCMDTHKYQDAVEKNKTAGIALKVNSTPSFLINGVPVRGLDSFEVFSQIIEQAKAGK